MREIQFPFGKINFQPGNLKIGWEAGISSRENGFSIGKFKDHGGNPIFALEIRFSDWRFKKPGGKLDFLTGK